MCAHTHCISTQSGMGMGMGMGMMGIGATVMAAPTMDGGQEVAELMIPSNKVGLIIGIYTHTHTHRCMHTHAFYHFHFHRERWRNDKGPSGIYMTL